MKNLLILMMGILFGVEAFMAVYFIQGVFTYQQPLQAYFWIAVYLVTLVLLGLQIIKLINTK